MHVTDAQQPEHEPVLALPPTEPDRTIKVLKAPIAGSACLWSSKGVLPSGLRDTPAIQGIGINTLWRKIYLSIVDAAIQRALVVQSRQRSRQRPFRRVCIILVCAAAPLSLID
jgi:hypothetical protein